MRRSISFHIYVSAIVATSVLVTAAGMMGFLYQRNDVRKALDDKLEELKTRIPGLIIEPLWLLSEKQLDTILSMEMKNHDILFVRVWNEQNKIIAEFDRKQDGTVSGMESADGTFITESLYRRINVPLKKDDFQLGLLELGITDYFALRELSSRFMADILRSMVASAIGLVFVLYTLKTTVLDALGEISGTVSRFGAKDFSARAHIPKGNDEMADLARTFNTMADLIQDYSVDMERLVNERTQQLIEAEKLALLGSLVAGVAHEINTPIGIAVTVASHIQERSREIRLSYDAQKMTKSLLENFLSENEESASILLMNLSRAGDFVRSFKQVAIDQNTDDTRTFKLRPYIEEIVVSLKPQLKKTPHVVEFDIPADSIVCTSPGALSQILTNFIVNSLLHGYDDNHGGTLRIWARTQTDTFTIRYSDDGKGIAKEHLSKIFEPFFTTKRGAGGSGLGLYIVQTIIAKQGGSIQCESEPDKGVGFVVTLPNRIVATVGVGA